MDGRGNGGGLKSLASDFWNFRLGGLGAGGIDVATSSNVILGETFK
jgi:hypothetical protein